MNPRPPLISWACLVSIMARRSIASLILSILPRSLAMNGLPRRMSQASSEKPLSPDGSNQDRSRQYLPSCSSILRAKGRIMPARGVV